MQHQFLRLVSPEFDQPRIYQCGHCKAKGPREILEEIVCKSPKVSTSRESKPLSEQVRLLQDDVAELKKENSELKDTVNKLRNETNAQMRAPNR